MALSGLAVSLVAVLVSVVAFEVNRRSAADAERHGRMPVLIARRYDRDTLGIRNIGNGPALNIVIARGTGKLASIDVLDAVLGEYQNDGTWTGHMHLAPIPAGEEHCYAWAPADIVGLTLTDALGRHYTAVSSRFGTKVVDGFEMSHPPLSDLSYPKRIDVPTDI